MSYDLAVWEGDRPAGDADAAAAFERLMDQWHGDDAVEKLQARLRGEQTDHDPTPAIAGYVDALLSHWPDITTDEGEDSPWSDGPLINNASGPIVYLGMVFSQCDEASEYASRLAEEHGLVCFDPQSGTLRP